MTYMKTRHFLTGTMLALAVPAVAQDDTAGMTRDGFCSHAFIQVQGGAQYTLGESGFTDLLSPNVQIGLGWQFTPWLGARLGAGAWQSKGGFNGYMTGGQAGNVTYKYNYVAPAVDVMFNLSNAFCGYNPGRTVSLTAFVGGGANIAFGNDEANDINNAGYAMAYVWEGTKVRPVGRGGIGIDFRLSRAVSIGIEANANVMSDRYNSKKAGSADWYFNALAGLKIALGGTAKKQQPVPDPVPEPVSRPVEQPAVEEKPQPVVEQPVEEKAPEEVRCDIFFRINSFNIRESELPKIAQLAEYLEANPEARLRVTGYADAKTGTEAVNDRLSRRRAEAVARLLTRKYGIAAGRIVTEAEGARVQPFAENDMNRVSICVTEQ